LCRNSS